MWESDFDNNVSKKDKVQELNINQLNLKVHDTFKKDEKRATKFEAVDGVDAINKSYLEEKQKKETVISLISKTNTTNLNYKTTNNLKKKFLFNDQRAVETTIYVLYDKGV